VTLLHPWLLLLALLVPAALWWRRRRGAPAVPFAPGPLARDLPRTWRVRLLPAPRVLETAGLLLVVAALARPVHRVAVPHLTEGLDLVLCLDTSSSMAATDMDPQRTRLDVAKAAAARFIAERPHDRIGLVCFARYPDLRCPPTLDHDALRQILDAVEIVDSDGPEDATGIGTAVARAAQVLGGEGTGSRVVILLTDGEENIATKRRTDEIAPLHAGQLCRELGVRAYAISAGLGTRNEKGEWVEIDTTQVESLAKRTGGRFFAARDAGAVASVYGEIDALEKIEFAEPRYRLEEGFWPLLATALALLVIGRLLHATLLEVSP
jgi:Ca-activated chloride channel family protein